jgi:fluoroquinolone transport system permease protein
MRMKNLIKWDIYFQIKYGFYFIYAVLTILYILLLIAFPLSWRKNAMIMMIFSDPAAMGLFFMGAIVLLEKSQKVINLLAVSPVKVWEYILSKVVSLAIVSDIVAFVLAMVAKTEDIILILLGTALTSVVFTLLGLIAATKINSLNQFVLVTVPIELVCFIPAVLYLFGYSSKVLNWYPINLCLSLIANKTENRILTLLLIVVTILILFVVAYYSTSKMFKSVGGVKE